MIDKLELKTYRYAAYKVFRLLVYMLFILWALLLLNFTFRILIILTDFLTPKIIINKK